jgi:hypothetical protein
MGRNFQRRLFGVNLIEASLPEQPLTRPQDTCHARLRRLAMIDRVTRL